MGSWRFWLTQTHRLNCFPLGLHDYGVNIYECKNNLSLIHNTDIQAAIDDLQAQGFIHSTINENHYKTAM